MGGAYETVWQANSRGKKRDQNQSRSGLRDCEKGPANHANDTNGVFFIRVIWVIRGPNNLAAAFFHSL